MSFTTIQLITVWVLPVLFAITLHEAAHGLCAYKLGDPTAKLLGRVTANPIAHIDPIGTIAVPLILGYLSSFQFIFGWAKPVPISPANFKNPRRDNALVALAGPAANFAMALFWGLCLKVTALNFAADSQVLQFLALSAKAGILINAVLMAFNLLPIPPLDGSRVLSSALPPKYDYYFSKIEPYGFIILMVLIVTQVIHWLIMPIIFFLISLIFGIYGL